MLCLTMGALTTSWWVVSQPIVVAIFIYAFPCLDLLSFSCWDFIVVSLHIVSLLYPTFGGVTFMIYVDIIVCIAL